MLNMYQLWLDDLYPRAKFADALAIIEKVGHTKRMHIMRKDWIDEGKPRRAAEPDSDDDMGEDTAQQSTEAMDGIQSGSGHMSEHQEHVQEPAVHSAEQTTSGDPDDDELDALLAESEQQPSTTVQQTLPTRPMPVPEDDPFADEMEAMADMEEMWD